VHHGLILATESEAELAGVLAHGIAHTALRGATRQATKGELMQLASIPAMIFTPYGESFACYYQGLNLAFYQGLNLAIPLTFLKHGRDTEFDADFFGLQYLYKAGYDREAYLHFIERLPPPAGPPRKTAPKVFSPLPAPVERAKTIREEINHLLRQRDNAKVSSSESEAVKERLRTWQP
jgi:predicted Zn-dependent protease